MTRSNPSHTVLMKLHILSPYMVYRDSIKVISNRKEYWRKSKKKQIGRFLVIVELILAFFLRSQSYDFDAIAHAGAPLGVE